MLACHEIHFAMGHELELFGHRIVEGESDRQRAERFCRELRGLRHDEKELIVDGEDVAVRAAGERRIDARLHGARGFLAGGPAWTPRPAAGAIRDDAELCL